VGFTPQCASGYLGIFFKTEMLLKASRKLCTSKKERKRKKERKKEKKEKKERKS